MEKNKVIVKDMEIQKGFEDLFEFPDEIEENKHEAKMIMFRFLSEIERVSNQERGFKKMLANAVGKSKSYITQLFNGDKFVNFLMLAKFQKALGIKFKIIAYPEDEFHKHTGHEPKYAVNIFLTQNDPVEAAKATSNEVAHIQVIHQSNPIYS